MILSSLKSRVHNPRNQKHRLSWIKSTSTKHCHWSVKRIPSLTIQLNISNLSQTTQLKTSTSHPWNLSGSLHPYLLSIFAPNSTCPCVVRPRPRNDWRHGSCCYPWASIRPRNLKQNQSEKKPTTTGCLSQLGSIKQTCYLGLRPI